MIFGVLLFGGFVQLFVWLRVLFASDAVHGGYRSPNRCIHCDYDLAGLPTDPVCPECGTHNTPQAFSVRQRRGIDPTLVPHVLLASALAAISAGSVCHSALVVDLLRCGYPWLVATRYAQMHASPTPVGVLLSVFYVALTPYAAAVRPRAKALRILWGWLLAICLIDMLTSLSDL